jgi:hypothetical protein
MIAYCILPCNIKECYRFQIFMPYAEYIVIPRHTYWGTCTTKLYLFFFRIYFLTYIIQLNLVCYLEHGEIFYNGSKEYKYVPFVDAFRTDNSNTSKWKHRSNRLAHNVIQLYIPLYLWKHVPYLVFTTL